MWIKFTGPDLRVLRSVGNPFALYILHPTYRMYTVYHQYAYPKPSSPKGQVLGLPFQTVQDDQDTKV